MAWTAPTTFVDGNVLTAALLNTNVRDNALETMPGKATIPLQHFVVSGTNALIGRTISYADVAAAENTTSNTYTDLSTVGPTITVTTGTKALVIFTSAIECEDATIRTLSVSVAVSGASTIAAADDIALRLTGLDNKPTQATMAHLFTTLTGGSNTFTMKYKSVGSVQVKFYRRQLIVIPF